MERTEKDKCRHCVHFIVKTALHVATLATAVLAVHELDKINRRLKRIEQKRRLL